MTIWIPLVFLYGVCAGALIVKADRLHVKKLLRQIVLWLTRKLRRRQPRKQDLQIIPRDRLCMWNVADDWRAENQ